MTFRAYPDQKSLCPVHNIWKYLQEVRLSRSSDDNLFITIRKPYHGASPDTIARWIKDMLSLSGIDTGVFTAHSCRAASTSSGLFRGISIGTILGSACWSNVNTFKNHYLKEIESGYNLKRDNFGAKTLDNLSL